MIRIRNLFPAEVATFKKKYKDSVPDKLDYHIIIGLLDYNEIVGGIVINLKPDIEIYHKLKLDPDVSISFFWVDPDYRNHGYGEKLFVDSISRYDRIALITGKRTTKEAEKIYKKYNFKVVSINHDTKYWYRSVDSSFMN